MKKQILISTAVTLSAFLLAASRIDNGLVDSPLPAGPGLTLDESFNIVQGYYLFDAFLEHGPMLYTPSVAKTVFGSEHYLADHPLLGRCLLGAAHGCLSWLIPGGASDGFNVPAARLGSCLAFAATVLLLFEFTRRQYGLFTAALTATALMIMPRVVGHARLASLETATSLAWLAAWVPLWTWWTGKEPPTVKQTVISGFLFGLLMLTKVQGILVPPLVVIWSLWQFRQRAFQPLLLWGAVAGLVFFLGWPWLWLDPIGNTLTWLGTASERQPLYVWYLGNRFLDKAVPWHYPFVTTALTIPLAVLICLLLRLFQRQFSDVEKLVLASVAWPLIVFAIPGTPVYDGSRLFLVIMPGIAVLAGRGVSRCLETNSRQESRKRVALLCLPALAAVISVFSVLHPFAINSYSLVVGRAAGARALGMESCYWSDGLNGDFWKQVPENSTVYVAPVSHQFQLNNINHFVPIVASRNIQLKPFLYDPQKQRGLILLIHRLADLSPTLRTNPEGAPVIAESRLEGVTLCRLIDTSNATWARIPPWQEELEPADAR